MPQIDEGMNEQENELMNKPIAHLPECKGTQYSTYLKYIVCPRHHAGCSRHKDTKTQR